jgi:hypothetical protein
MPGPLACAQRTECFADCPVILASSYGDQHTKLMVAERSHKTDLLLCSRASSVNVGRTEMRDQSHREHVDNVPAIMLVRFDDLDQRRAAERTQSQKAGAKCGARFAPQTSRVTMGKCESARHSPLTRLCRPFKNKRIRRIEPDSAQQLHRFGPPVIGSGPT